MKGARTFTLIMALLVIFAFGILVESSINENEHTANLKLTQKTQEQFELIQDLQQNLSVCNWELGKKESIELIAPVRAGVLK